VAVKAGRQGDLPKGSVMLATSSTGVYNSLILLQVQHSLHVLPYKQLHLTRTHALLPESKREQKQAIKKW
jgi:hypothetical protein